MNTLVLRRRVAPLTLAVAAATTALAGCVATAVPSPSISAPSAASATVSAPSAVSRTSAPSEPSAPESNPPGDIPDNQVFISYRPPAGGWQVKVPEGWAQSTAADGAVTFTDKLNSIRLVRTASAARPNAATVRSAVVTADGSRSGFAFEKVSTVDRTAGQAILATYRVDADPDPVTGKTINDDVEQYVFWRNGVQVDLRLAGPHGADNVDPWRIVTDSFRWSK